MSRKGKHTEQMKYFMFLLQIIMKMDKLNKQIEEELAMLKDRYQLECNSFKSYCKDCKKKGFLDSISQISAFQHNSVFFAEYAMYIEHDYVKARQFYYKAAKCIEYHLFIQPDVGWDYKPKRNAAPIKVKVNRMDRSIGNIFYAVLSDNHSIIERFVSIRDYPVFENLEFTLYAIIQSTLKKNKEELTQHINFIKKKCEKRDRHYWGMIDTFEGIRDNNKLQAEAGLAELAGTQHRRNLGHHKAFYSFDTTTYAKLAWRQGLEVEIDSPLVPKEMLPVMELDDYPIYDFLKVLDDPDYKSVSKPKWNILDIQGMVK
ncbi:MAG: immunity 49 family protein [Bacteroidales bacterium]|jgi:hypothetical protein|nr:immunity 49 family protein [Bacteroidales bacterium]